MNDLETMSIEEKKMIAFRVINAMLEQPYVQNELGQNAAIKQMRFIFHDLYEGKRAVCRFFADIYTDHEWTCLDGSFGTWWNEQLPSGTIDCVTRMPNPTDPDGIPQCQEFVFEAQGDERSFTLKLVKSRAIWC